MARNHYTEIVCDSCGRKVKTELPPSGWISIELYVSGTPSEDPAANVLVESLEGGTRTWDGMDVQTSFDLCDQHYCRAYGIGSVLMKMVGRGTNPPPYVVPSLVKEL